MHPRRRRRPPRLPLRLLPDIFLTGVSVVAVVFAVLASDVAWIAVWIGLAATAASAALVDVSAVGETSRRLAPVRSLAGRRIGRAHQIVLAILAVVFDDLQISDPRRWPEVLRSAPDAPLDLLTQAKNIHPPRTREQRLRELSDELAAVHEELVALAAAGVLTSEIGALDEILESAPFLVLVRVAFAIQPRYTDRRFVSQQAADTISAIQALMPAAARAAGQTWRYGDWAT